MSAGELRFIEPYLDRACYCCAKKGDWSRVRKLLRCNGCCVEYMPMPDGKLAIMNRPHVDSVAAAKAEVLGPEAV
jgi:hypothetical protein